MITLVLGGARSGKSELAEQIVTSLPGPVSYLATARLDGDDADLAARVQAHQARRPAEWVTVEVEEDLPKLLTDTSGTVLVDSLGTWVAGADEFKVDADALCAALTARTGDTVLVSDEVGLGVHPSTELGRHYRDALGEVNRAVADLSDQVLLVVAGRPVPLGPTRSRSSGRHHLGHLDLMAALSFLTPLGSARTPTPRSLAWFPVVGAAIGVVLGVVWWLARHAFPPNVAAALVVGADLAITGLLHFDGLVDSADGLLPPLTPDRRLAVMAAPEAGAFGLGVGGVVLLARWAALASLKPAVTLLAGAWCLSRTGMAAIARTQPYVRGPGGLAAAFTGQTDPVTGVALVAGALGALVLSSWWRVLPGAVSLAVGAAVMAAVMALARRRIGGFTGDVLGAAGVLAETAVLVVAAARW